MSLSKKKSNIINKIKLYSSIANSNIDINSFNDISTNSDDPIDFLFDIVKTTIGENGLETLVETVLSKILSQKKLNQLSDKFYDAVGKTISENISTNELTLNISTKTIDPTKQFNINPSTQNNDFFNRIKNNVLAVPNTDVPFTLFGTNKNINMKYIESTDTLETKIPQTNALELFNGLKGLIGPIFSSTVIINEILNILFHTNFKKEDAQILTLVRSYTKYETKDVFKLDLKKLLDLELDTEIKGINIDTNCFRENIKITQIQIDNLIQNPTVSNFNTLVPEFNTDTNTNAKNDYHKNIIKAIIEAIISVVIKQPVVLFFITIINKIIDFTTDLNNLDIPSLIIKLTKLFESIFDSLYELIFCIIFDFIKKHVIKLVVIVAIQLIKEQLEKRGKILESLSPFKIKENLKTILT
jgi:hypothetical protein